MTATSEYTPPKVWTWNKPNGGPFANINRPIAGPTHEKELPVGRHPLQLYSLATPNGVKVTVMLEELLALGHAGAEYDAWLIRISDGDQFGSGFVAVNPELQDPGADGPQRPEADPGLRVRLRSCCISPRSSARSCRPRAGRARRMPVVAVLADGQRALSRRRLRPFLRLRADEDRICDRPLRDGGEAAARRARPAPRGKRVSGGRRLHDRRHGGLALVRRAGARAGIYEAGEFLSVHDYTNVLRWADAIAARPAVQARAHGQPRLRRAVRASCTSAMTPATSTRRRRTSWRRPRVEARGTQRVHIERPPRPGSARAFGK